MSVIGVDFGNSSSIVARVGRGGVDVVLNGNSNRKTPTVVSFMEKQRMMGEEAAAVASSNFRNTVTSMKRLIGLPFNSAAVQKEAARLPVKLVEMEGGRTGVKVNYDGEERTFGVEMIAGSMLESIRKMVEGGGGPPVTDVVVSVPGYFSDAQRRAMLDACHVAGLKCLRLMNDLTAAAIEYGIYKSARRQFSDSEAQHVMFVDMGHSAYQVSIVAFLQGKLQVLAYAFDRELGGRDYDALLADEMARQFQEKTGKTAESAKARMKLLSAVEKARKTLSPVGVKEVRVDVECLNGDHDLHTKITEEEFAEWTEALTARTVAPIDAVLQQSGLKASDLRSVEILGGAVRMRVVKQRIAAHLGLENQAPPNFGLSTTLNMDECIARGCALQSAILSPLFRVKEFNVIDRVLHSVRLSWEEAATGMEVEDDEEGGADNTLVIFKAGEDTPKLRRVTFRRTEPFTVTATYDDTSLLPEGASEELGRFVVQGIPAPEEGEEVPRIRVNLRHDIHGCFNVASAQFLKEKKEAPPAEAEGKEAAEGKAGDAAAPAAEGEGAQGAAEQGQEGEGKDGEAAAGEGPKLGDHHEAPPAHADDHQPTPSPEATPTPAAAAAGAEAPKKKRYTRVNLPFESQLAGMTDKELMEAREAELNMQSQDRLVEEAMRMRNELESYMYDFRDKMIGELASFSTSDEKSAFEAKSEDLEDWLYSDEGTSCTKKEYAAKLDELRAIGDRVQRRKIETETRPAAITRLRGDVERFLQTVNGSPDHEHLSEEDRNYVRKECSEASKWLDDLESAQMKLALAADPVLTTADLTGKANALATACKPIVNKPKPKPKEEEEEKKEEGDAKAANGSAEAKADGADAASGDQPKEGEKQGGMEEEEDGEGPAEVE